MQIEQQELSDWLRLLITPGIGNVSARKLLKVFGLPHNIFTQDYSKLIRVVSATQAKNLLSIPENFAQQLDLTQQWLANSTRRNIISLADANYPPQLLQIHDPPLLLFVESAIINYDFNVPALAMVGSRSPTPQAKQDAYQFAKYFAASNICIVSGLALGIDGYSHQGALDGANKALATIAVLGTGIDRIYPSQHTQLAQQVIEQGILISEFALQTAPSVHNFPKRNRLIAALSDATLVVEASLRSGSLITARCALEQNKEVFAIPGSIHSPLARGCNALIKQGAKLVETAADVFDEMTTNWGYINANVASLSSPITQPNLAPQLAKLYQLISYSPIDLEQLSQTTELPIDQLQSSLFELELLGLIARIDGGKYQKISAK